MAVPVQVARLKSSTGCCNHNILLHDNTTKMTAFRQQLKFPLSAISSKRTMPTSKKESALVQLMVRSKDVGHIQWINIVSSYLLKRHPDYRTVFSVVSCVETCWLVRNLAEFAIFKIFPLSNGLSVLRRATVLLHQRILKAAKKRQFRKKNRSGVLFLIQGDLSIYLSKKLM